jgi:methylated-DNA-[protein]-cysteine S-methyltransferase
MTANHTLIESPIGALTLVAEDGALTGLYFPHHWYRPDPATFGPWVEQGVERGVEHGFDEARAQLAEYFAGERRHFDLPLHAAGTEFQQRVWALLHRIEPGRTTTYGELAAELGDPALAREVGAAVGRNPLSIVVPCHRVLGKGGKLTGYAGGLARKRFLLDLERSDAALAGTLF